MTDKALREAVIAARDAPPEPNEDVVEISTERWFAITAALAAPEPEGDMGPRTPENSMVICPNCTCQFTAISVDDQARMSAIVAENERLQRELLVANASLLEPCPRCAETAAERNTATDALQGVMYTRAQVESELFEVRQALLTEGQEADRLRARCERLEAALEAWQEFARATDPPVKVNLFDVAYSMAADALRGK